MFGKYVKKKAVISMIEDEMKINHRLALNNETLAKALHRDGSPVEAKWHEEHRENYYTRYMMCKELLLQLEKL